ncbi:MAG TPA: GntR family transcriptional regulator [Rhizobacter sp.]|nr:GntR family transcriptional regulator [Rhizobacter sp.]
MATTTRRPAKSSTRASTRRTASPAVAANLPAPALGTDIEQRIYESVFEGVMTQRLTPGTKLPEAALCELFAVSRSLVRKVLQRLAHDRIVELRPNRGAVIAAPSPEQTRQIFEARRALEAALMELAVRNATKADLSALRRQLAEEHEAMHRFDQPSWARLASGFHLRVAALARNPILERYLTELVSRCSLIVALYEPPGNATCEHDEHAQIVDCIEKGDTRRAIHAMDSHLRELERHISLERTPPIKSLARMLGLN